MAYIVRPQKPPLHPAQQAAMVAAAQAQQGGVPAGYTPENMPIDVMTQAPAQQAAPSTEQVVVIPSDNATPQLPQQTVRGPGQDTATPQIQDMPVGDPNVAAPTNTPPTGDPASDEITTDDVMSTEDPGAAIPAALAALGVTAAAVAAFRKNGSTGDPRLDLVIRDAGLTGQIMEPEQITDQRATDVATRPAGDVIDGTVVDVNPPRTDNALPAPDGIENIDGSNTNAQTPTPQTPPVVADTSGPQQPAAPTTTPDGANGPTAGDPASNAISTEDVMPTDTTGNTRPPEIDGMSKIDGAPPGMPADYQEGIFSQTNSGDKTITSYVKGGEGQWYALDPIRATPQAMQAQREIIMNAMRAVRGGLR